MDFMGMMKKAQAVQAKLQEAQEELGRVEVAGRVREAAWSPSR